MRTRLNPLLVGGLLGLVFSLLYLLICAGCGVGSQGHFVVRMGYLHGTTAGYVFYDRGVIVVDLDQEEWSWPLIMRAELFHAGGGLGHPWGKSNAAHFRPEAVAVVAGIPGLVYLEPEDGLIPATVEAAEWWNAALGWEKFIVVP